MDFFCQWWRSGWGRFGQEHHQWPLHVDHRPCKQRKCPDLHIDVKPGRRSGLMFPRTWNWKRRFNQWGLSTEITAESKKVWASCWSSVPLRLITCVKYTTSVYPAFFKKSKMRHPGILQSPDSGTGLIFFIDLIVKFSSDLISAHDRKIGEAS
jgi:hypothetical protein